MKACRFTFILLPLALIVQILVGIPGSLIISKASSRQTAVVSAILLPILPLVFTCTSSVVAATTLEVFLPLIGVVLLFGIGSSVSLYYLRDRRISIAEEDTSG
jgi:hypothetical protein